MATRQAYGAALAKIAKTNPRVVALDGDMKNSTFSQELLKVDPSRYIECFICEQNMLGVGIGVACRDRTVAFASTFAAFLTRGFDNLRMGVISQTNLNVVGSHCGVSIGEDGPSQMALEDIAMFRSLPGCTVFYPSDAVACERAVELSANQRGICFVRVSRPATAVIYENNERFEIGKAKIVRSSDSDKVLVVAAGVTLYEALKAADTLASKGVNIRVIDPFTIKPIDIAAIRENAAACGGRVLTVIAFAKVLYFVASLTMSRRWRITILRVALETQCWMQWLTSEMSSSKSLPSMLSPDQVVIKGPAMVSLIFLNPK